MGGQGMYVDPPVEGRQAVWRGEEQLQKAILLLLARLLSPIPISASQREGQLAQVSQ